jgi:CheY-like chemotaxis protein
MCVADTNASSGTPRSVAIVDDDVRIRTLLRLELEDLGALVICFGSAEEAIDGIRNNSVDLVLLDVSMPIMNGPEACSWIQQNRSDCKVIALSML